VSEKIETVGDALIIWINGEAPYVFRNTGVLAVSTNHSGNTNGYQDITLALHGKLESKNGTMKISFNDGQHIISVKKFAAVVKDYGPLEDMSYEEFKERLLVLEI